MSLEKRIASVARTLFLPEFSFAANTFQVEKGEYELESGEPNRATKV
jgi:hypothetical protein